MGNINYYKNYHKQHELWGEGAIHFKDRLDIIIEDIKPQSILDYGCGKGKLVEYLKENYPNIDIEGYDPAVEKYAMLPKRRFELVTCTDVLEHIPENNLNDTIGTIFELSERVFFILHHGLAEAVLENGDNAHCTVKPPEWYYSMFKKWFPKVNYLPAEQFYNTSCITFDISNNAEIKYYRLTEHKEKEEMRRLITLNKLLRGLLCFNWEKINCQKKLVLYGFGYNCKKVYEIIKNKCQIRCFIDAKKRGMCDGLPIYSIKEYVANEDEIIVVFPEYDFEKIKLSLINVTKTSNQIIRASDFFM